MIEFKFRNVSPYLHVVVICDGKEIDLGFLNKEERSELAAILRDAADTLRGAADALAEGQDGS